MARLGDLVDTPNLRSLLTYLVRPADDPAIESVWIAEDLAGVEHAPARSLVLLTQGGSQPAGTYRFDVGMRMAREAKVGALVLAGPAFGEISSTAARIGERSGIAVLGAAEGVNLAHLAIAVARELGGGSDVALLRAHMAMRALASAPVDGKPSAVVESASQELGVPLRLGERPESGPAVAVNIEEDAETWLSAPPQEGDMEHACELVLNMTALTVGRMLAAARRADELPIQSRAEVLTELLAAAPQETPALVHRARAVGIPIDGWHVAVRLEFENASEVAGSTEDAAYEARQALFRVALQVARASGGTWHSGRAGQAMLLVRMYRDDPGVAAPQEVATAVERAMRRASDRIPGAALRCGVGSVHPGAAGLASSAAEAKAAVAVARAANRINKAVPFDSVGLRRTLVEWYASATAREAVSSVLAPLDRLGGRKAQQSIQTLQTYLDRQGSLARTAEALNLHRNAVSYRINRIFSLLDVEPDNPDDLLLLQLACRARELS